MENLERFSTVSIRALGEDAVISAGFAGLFNYPQIKITGEKAILTN